MVRLHVLWWFDNCLAVSIKGRSGGLAHLWMNELPLKVKPFFFNHVDTIVQNLTYGFIAWRATGFYGFIAQSY